MPYWLLQRPVAIAAAKSANRRLAAQLAADSGAVTNAATLRPPATYSHKTRPPTPVVLERLTVQLTMLDDVIDAIAAEPASPAPRPATASALAGRYGQDPLRELEPAVYVAALTGQAVSRSRKISCPFHEDRTPSFHVYEHTDAGYYCFGCRRHGQVPASRPAGVPPNRSRNGARRFPVHSRRVWFRQRASPEPCRAAARLDAALPL
ncbi:MAG TPA: CHC2 zinc finger domain-containing protein [Solirubrobacteraceae bacterium]